MKIVLAILGGMLFLLFAFITYLFSDFSEELRLKDRIKADLNVKLSSRPELIDAQSYGFNNGGDMSLMKLKPKDCLNIADSLKTPALLNTRDGAMGFINRNSLTGKAVITKGFFLPNTKRNYGGDSIYYALQRSNCVLYRHYSYD
jgi:hypothetical protein